MKLGICCDFANTHSAIEAGFDFVELPANALAILQVSLLNGLPIGSTNLFFPQGVRLFTGGFDWRAYALETISSAAGLGVKIMVVGSGYARSAPDGMVALAAELRFVDIVEELQSIASPYGITIAPEALNSKETNVFTDSRSLASALSEKGLSYTFDVYHALVEWDRKGWTFSPALLKREVALTPVHVHLADFERLIPSPKDSKVRAIFRHLRNIGFEGRVSLECRDVFFDDGLARKIEGVKDLLSL